MTNLLSIIYSMLCSCIHRLHQKRGTSRRSIENNRENHPIPNQIYDILTGLQNQGKQLTLSKVPAYIGIKGNEESDKAVKQANKTTLYRLLPDHQED